MALRRQCCPGCQGKQGSGYQTPRPCSRCTERAGRGGNEELFPLASAAAVRVTLQGEERPWSFAGPERGGTKFCWLLCSSDISCSPREGPGSDCVTGSSLSPSAHVPQPPLLLWAHLLHTCLNLTEPGQIIRRFCDGQWQPLSAAPRAGHQHQAKALLCPPGLTRHTQLE